MKNIKITSATIIMVIISMLILIDLASISIYYKKYSYYLAINSSGVISETILFSYNHAIQILSFVYLLGYVICGMFFIYWLTNAYLNLKLVFPELTGTNSQILLSWFIPIVSFYRPYLIMIDLFTYSDRLIQENVETKKMNLNLLIVHVWWPLWLVEKMFYLIVSKFDPDLFSIKENVNLNQFQMLGCIISVALSLVTIGMIYKYSKVALLLGSVIEKKTN